MPPTDERFSCDQAAVDQTNLGLGQLELAAIRGKRQFALRLQPVLQLLSDRTLEDHVTAAPRQLCLGQREMAVAQEIVSITPAVGIDGNADADLGPYSSPLRRATIAPAPTSVVRRSATARSTRSPLHARKCH